MKQDSIFIYYWHIDEKDEEITKIRAYGLDKNNKNVCLLINDFTPYVYLELPSFTQWNERKAQLLGNKLDEELREYGPVKKSLILKHKLYGAHIDKDGNKKKFPYLFCSFAHKTHINKYLIPKLRRSVNVQGIGNIKMKVHEGDADPILQLVCCRNIPSVGWIKFVGEEVSVYDKVTLAEKEYEVSWKGLYKVENDTVGLPLIMGFDIEVNSSNPTSMPKAKNPGDKVFQISCIFNREGSNKSEYYLLTLGEADASQVGDNIKVICCSTEAKLLTGFTELVREKNPNVIVGYNILGFDIEYMINRAKFNFCISSFDKIGFHLNYHSQEKKIKWSSSAYKNQEFSYLESEGRIIVDLLPLIRRDYKFNNYTLKTVSQEILKDDTKVDLAISRMFKLYKIGTQVGKDGKYSKKSIKAMSIIGKYCTKDSELCVKLMQKMQTWVGLTEFAKTCNTGVFSLYTQGQQIKVYSQVYKYCLQNNIVVEKDGYVTKEGERYAGAHVFPPVPGIYDRVLPFDFCLSGDTLITLSNGTSKRIDMLYDDQLVLGFNKATNGYENFSSINGLQEKGKKETIKLTLQDGRNIICTPEHKFMDENNNWFEAKDLKNKWIKTGLEYPEDSICKNELEWELNVEGYTFTMKNNVEREKSLAFARILGYILSDGSIYTTNVEESYCEFCNIIINTNSNLERHYMTETCKNNRIIYENNKNIHNIKDRLKSNIKPDKRFKKNRPDDRPKNKQNIYTIFSKIEFKNIQKQNPELNSRDIFKEIGKKWQQIKNNKIELEKYYKYIKEDEDRYNEEIKDYKDRQNIIKPKKSTYILFSLEEREKLKKEGIPSKEINSELSKRWKIIKNNPELLEKYKILEKEEELRYNNELKQYCGKNIKDIKKTRPIFWFFYDIEKDNLYKKYPKLTGKEIMKKAQNLWKEIKADKNEYEKYKKLSEEDKIRYNTEINQYIPNKIYKNDIKINKRKVSEAAFGTLLDAQNFMNDIKKFVDKDINIIKRIGNNNTRRGLKGTTFNITLPVYITKMLHSLEDIVIGKRSTQSMKFPKFILEDNCPISIIKEFISGLYGGDGHTVCLSQNKFSNISFSWYTIQNKIEDMLKLFNILLKLHNKIGIECKILDPVLVKYKENDPMIPFDIEQNPRYNITLEIKYKNVNIFFKNLCFKYCVNKQYKLVIANSYYNYKYNNNNGTLDINNYLKLIKTELWFQKRSYSVKQDDISIPSYRQKVIKIENNGIKNVYDIEVNHVHNFLANGAVSHNCSLYPTT
jgi:DNA polymerase elongation subunit (family B)